MISCLSPNGQTNFQLSGPPTRLLVGSVHGVVHLGRDDVVGPWKEEHRSLSGLHIGALINAQGGRLFAGCHGGGGLHRSLDGGITWTQVGPGIEATDIFSLAVLETNSGPAVLAGVEPVNLYRSDDFGDSWRELPTIADLPGAENWTFPPPPHIPHLKSMAINPAISNSFYACVEQGALLKTDDAGLSWRELSSMWRADDAVYHDAHRLVVTPWNPQLLIFTSGLGLFRSVDGGSSWIRNLEIGQHTKYPDVLVASPLDKAIFVGGPSDYPVDWLGGDATGTVSRSVDDGVTWVTVAAGLPRNTRANIEGMSLAVHPQGYTLFIGNTDGQIFSSENRGETWQQIGKTAAVSKGAHHKIAQLSVKLPNWVGAGATKIFDKVTKFTGKRAAVKRRSEFNSRSATRRGG